ncbi:MAG: glycosyltransferase, exosortase A system-associated [Magnetococcales bacterium]|nr:glycosyltransferase, exosortase A system-associated [Magnetococcales bacterium]
MRILHILDHSAPLQSGYVSRTQAILRQQQALGWETCHLTGPRHPSQERLADTVDNRIFHRTPCSRSLLTRLPFLEPLTVVSALKKRILAVADSVQPDLLHAHSPVLDGLAAWQAGQSLGIPVIYEIRAFWEDAAVSHGTARPNGPRYHLSRALETYLVRRVDAVTVICEGLRLEILARGVPPDRVTVIPNAVEVERFAPAAKTTAPPPRLDGIDTRKREILGFFGSFYAYEGLSLLLEAMPAIRARRPDILLLLVGGGPEETTLRQRTRELGLEGQVHFTGRIAPETVPDYYALVDLMVFPRRPMRLTHLVTPLKPLEAMAAQKLVVASDVRGHRELITHGQTGVLFPADQGAALTDTLISLLENRASWEPMIRQAARFVREERTWSASVDRYRPVYETLISARRAKREARP